MGPKAAKKHEKTKSGEPGSTHEVDPAINALASTAADDLNLRPLGAAALTSDGATPSPSLNAIQAEGEDMSVTELLERVREIARDQDVTTQMESLIDVLESLDRTVRWIGDQEDDSLKVRVSSTLSSVRSKASLMIARGSCKASKSDDPDSLTLCQEAKEIFSRLSPWFDHFDALAMDKAFRRRESSFGSDLTVKPKEVQKVDPREQSDLDDSEALDREEGKGLPQVPPPGSKPKSEGFNPDSFPDEIARQRSEALHAAASFRPASFRKQGARPKVPIAEVSSGRPDFRSNPDYYGVPGQYRPDGREQARRLHQDLIRSRQRDQDHWRQNPDHPSFAVSDLDGVELSEAWLMPETPTLAHLEKDINLLEKSGAIPKFSGELVDYIMWRAAFLETVHYKVNEPATRKIVALQKALPDAVLKEISKGWSFTPQGYARCIEILERLYGNRDDLYHVVMTNLLSVPEITSLMNLDALKKFVRTYDEFKDHAVNLGFGYDDRMIYTQISSKLRVSLVLQFQKEMKQQGKGYTASNLRDWIEDARLNLNSIHRKEETKTLPKEAPTGGTFGKVFVSTGMPEVCSFCSAEGHRVTECDKFARASPADRLRHIRKSNLCFLCLQEGHMASKCPQPIMCMCGRNHHPKLHKEDKGKVTNVKAFVSYGVEIPYSSESEDDEDGEFEDVFRTEETEKGPPQGNGGRAPCEPRRQPQPRNSNGFSDLDRPPDGT